MKLTNEAIDGFEKVRKGLYRGVSFRIESDGICGMEQLIEKQGSDSTEDVVFEWNTFVELLPQDECRYIVYDMRYRSSETNTTRNKVLFFIWAPTGASVKQKMLTAFCAHSITSQLASGSGISARLQAASFADLDYSVVLEKALRTATVK